MKIFVLSMPCNRIRPSGNNVYLLKAKMLKHRGAFGRHRRIFACTHYNDAFTNLNDSVDRDDLIFRPKRVNVVSMFNTIMMGFILIFIYIYIKLKKRTVVLPFGVK